MRPTDVEARRPDGAARRGAVRRARASGPIFLGGPLRLPHVVLAVAFDPSWAAASASWPPRCRSSAWRTTSPRCDSADTDVKLLDGARAAVRRRVDAPRRRQAWRPSGCPARARASCRRPNRVAEYASGGRHADRRLCARCAVGARRRWSTRPSTRALLPVEPIRWATAVLDRACRRSSARSRRASSRGGCRDRVAALAAARARSPPAIWRRASPADGAATSWATWRRRSTRWPTALDAARAEDHAADRTRSWPGTRRWRSASRTRPRELRQAQDLLLRSRSLSALGELGAGVAHEINNPLTGALGIVQLLLADLPGEPPGPAAAAGPGDARRCGSGRSCRTCCGSRSGRAGTTRRRSTWPRALDDAIELCGPSDLAARGHRGRAPVRRRRRPCAAAPRSCRRRSSS